MTSHMTLIHLLQFEDVVDKELLKVLVAEVDAELLKTVGLKCLKTKDVQHSNRETFLTTVLLREDGRVRE